MLYVEYVLTKPRRMSSGKISLTILKILRLVFLALRKSSMHLKLSAHQLYLHPYKTIEISSMRDELKVVSKKQHWEKYIVYPEFTCSVFRASLIVIHVYTIYSGMWVHRRSIHSGWLLPLDKDWHQQNSFVEGMCDHNSNIVPCTSAMYIHIFF